MNTRTTTQAPLGTTSVPQSKDSIRVYVACLAAYNSGHLHGCWIDVSLGEEHIWDEARAMLKASPISEAEEYAVHDFEGFEGAPIEEYTSFKIIVALAEFIEEHGTLGGKVLAHFGGDIADAQTANAVQKPCDLGLFDEVGFAPSLKSHKIYESRKSNTPVLIPFHMSRIQSAPRPSSPGFFLAASRLIAKQKTVSSGRFSPFRPP